MADAMVPDDALAELAQHHGIECACTDAHDEHHQISADTQRAVLRTLGVDTSSDEAIRAALHERQRGAREAHARPPAATGAVS